jgi:hypothetical protein
VKGAHTPGPWAVHPHFAYVVPEAHSSRLIGVAEDDAYDLAHYAQEICSLHHPDRHRSEGEVAANARLIAAAPALLEALENAAAWFEDYAKEHYAKALTAPDSREQHSREVKGKINKDRAADLRAAIALAKQEQA